MHSGAGRIVSVRMRPLTLSERRVATPTVSDYVDEILSLDGYIDRIVEREFPRLGVNIRNPSALRRWLAAYAAATATSTSYERLRDAASGGGTDKPAKKTCSVWARVRCSGGSL